LPFKIDSTFGRKDTWECGWGKSQLKDYLLQQKVEIEHWGISPWSNIYFILQSVQQVQCIFQPTTLRDFYGAFSVCLKLELGLHTLLDGQ
jgi:hypothetical protein